MMKAAVVYVRVEGDRNFPLGQVRLAPHDFAGLDELIEAQTARNPVDPAQEVLRKIFKDGIAIQTQRAQMKDPKAR